MPYAHSSGSAPDLPFQTSGPPLPVPTDSIGRRNPGRKIHDSLKYFSFALQLRDSRTLLTRTDVLNPAFAGAICISTPVPIILLRPGIDHLWSFRQRY